MSFPFPPHPARNSWPQLEIPSPETRPNTPASSTTSSQTEAHSTPRMRTTTKNTTHEYASDSSVPQLTCAICKRRYSRKDNLKTHQRVHTKEKPFSCTICPKKFRWVGTLRNHEHVHRRRAARASISKTDSANSSPMRRRRSRNAAARSPPMNGASSRPLAAMSPPTKRVDRSTPNASYLAGELTKLVLQQPILDMIDQELVPDVPLPDFDLDLDFDLAGL